MMLLLRLRNELVAAIVLTLSLVVISQADAANGSVIYTYDALGRLMTASYDTGICITYSYDANGNRLSENILVPASGGTGIWGCFNWNSANWGP